MSSTLLSPRVFAPVATPFTADLDIDVPTFQKHCHWLLGQGADLAVFGTNSEAASISAPERMELLERLLAANVDPERLMPGTGCCSLPDSVALIRHALSLGIDKVLVLPPFFYKNVTDEGLFSYFSALIDKVQSPRLALYLYHIPGMTQVPISITLIERLRARYPQTVAGVKDSSGSWDSTNALLQAFATRGLRIYCASERFLSQTLANGGAGCISATVNVNPAAIRHLADNWSGAEGPDLQAKVTGVRSAFERYPMIAAMKQALSVLHADPGWSVLRPPLESLGATARTELDQSIRSLGLASATLARG